MHNRLIAPQRVDSRGLDCATADCYFARLCFLAAIYWCVVSIPSSAAAQRPAASSPPQANSWTSNQQADSVAAALARTGTVSFRGAQLAEVILILSQEWDVNIIAGSQISGEVSGTFKNESLQQILDSILTANGYNYRQIGNNLIVMTGDAVGAKPNFTVEVVALPIGEDEDLEELLEALKTQMSPDGKLLPVKASGKLTIQDTPDNIAAVKQLLQRLAAGSIEQYVSAPANSIVQDATRVSSLVAVSGALELRPQFIAAKDLQLPLAMVVGDTNLALVEEENFIVVLGDANTQEKARLLMQQLDKPRAQVRITSYIYDVALGEIERLGVDFNQRMFTQTVDANGIPRNLAMQEGGLMVPAPPSNAATVVSGIVSDTATTTTQAVTSASGPQFLFRTLNNQFELQALVQALDQTQGSRLLADPHVTVLDRRTASLGIVTKIPIQQLTQTQQGGSIASTAFEEAGIKLEVIPRISSDGTIEMQVTPEFSRLTGFQNGNPIIDTRIASTVVRVTHGQALVIGGLRSRTAVETVKGIPGLMNIKYIGCLFRLHDTDVRESELVVMIMPEIVGWCGGTEREMLALDVQRKQLSRIQPAIDGPILCDCRDKFCPHHHPRPRLQNPDYVPDGAQQVGLIGGFDPVFVNPLPPAMYAPVERADSNRQAPPPAVPLLPTSPRTLDGIQ